MRSRLAGLGLVLLAGAASGTLGCRPTPVPSAKILVAVRDEAKGPVAGALIVAQAQVVATTNDEGRAELTVQGREGEAFELEVRCPPVYRSPTSTIAARSVHLAGGAAPEYVTKCLRLRHTLTIGIHAEGGAGMPVRHLGKEIARTDDDGNAHVVVDGSVNDRIDLLLDTTDAKFAKVHPQNPMASFAIGEADDVGTFEAKFTTDPKPVRRAPKKTGPVAF